MGDHVRTFNLLNFRGRFPLDVEISQKSSSTSGGVSTHTLTEDEFPAVLKPLHDILILSLLEKQVSQ